MRVPQVSERIKEAPAQALRGVFADPWEEWAGLLAPVNVFLYAFSGRSTLRRSLADFECHRPRQPRSLARTQREQQVLALKVGAMNQVHYAQTGRHRPANIDAQQIRFRYVLGGALDKI